MTSREAEWSLFDSDTISKTFDTLIFGPLQEDSTVMENFKSH